jgi:DNA-binding NtrC family response regulator
MMKPKLIAIHKDPLVLKNIIRYTAAGFEIALGRSGGEAVTALQHGKVHAILVGPNPDGCGGLELLETIRQSHPAIRRLLIAPADQLTIIVQGLHSGIAQAILYQPLVAGDLLAALRRPA